MDFLDTIYFEYIQDLPTERRDELFSMLDDFFYEEHGTFSELFNTTDDTGMTTDNAKEFLVDALGNQLILDIETFNLQSNEVNEILTSIKYFLFFKIFELDKHITKKELKKMVIDHEVLAINQLSKMYNVYQHKVNKPRGKQGNVIDFKEWKAKVTRDGTN